MYLLWPYFIRDFLQKRFQFLLLDVQESCRVSFCTTKGQKVGGGDTGLFT